MKWSKLNKLGQSKFSKTSYIYIVVVPLLTKILSTIESPVSFKINDFYYSLNFDIQYSWFCFYFGAVCFAIASALYAIFCPQLIQRYANYSDFLNQGAHDYHIIETANKYKIDDRKVNSAIEKLGSAVPFIKGNSNPIQVNPTYDLIKKDAFYSIYKWLEKKNTTARILSLLFYIFGFALFVSIIVYNFVFVVNYLYP